MNEIAIENFIDFCDDMMIAEESFIDSLKQKLKKLILGLIAKIEIKIRSCKDSKVKSFLLNILATTKKLLGCVETANTPEQMRIIEEEVEQVNEQIDEIVEPVAPVNKKLKPGQDGYILENDPKWNRCPGNLRGLIKSRNVNAARNMILFELDNLTSSKRISLDDINSVSRTIGCISYFFADSLYESDGKLHVINGNFEEGVKNISDYTRMLKDEFSKGTLQSISSQLSSMKISILRESNNSENDKDLY